MADWFQPEQDDHDQPCNGRPRSWWSAFAIETGEYALGPVYCRRLSCSYCVAEKIRRLTKDIAGQDFLVLLKAHKSASARIRKRINRAKGSAFVVTLTNNRRLYLTLPRIAPDILPAKPIDLIQELVESGLRDGVSRCEFLGSWTAPQNPPKLVSTAAKAGKWRTAQAVRRLGWEDGHPDDLTHEEALRQINEEAEKIKDRPQKWRSKARDPEPNHDIALFVEVDPRTDSQP